MAEAPELGDADEHRSGSGSLREVSALFLKLGTVAFGGPAAHIAMMHDEVVVRRAWVSEQEFLDLLGASNLIPGPNSTELAIHVGYRRAGWRGLIAAGALFILPAMLIVITFAWAYVRYESRPQAGWLLYGIKPVVIAIIGVAIWRIGRSAVKSPLLAAVGVAVLALYVVGGNEIALLFGGGIFVMLIENRRRFRRGAAAALAVPFAGGPFAMVGATIGGGSSGYLTLFLTFVKIGSLLYGSGYVLLAFLHNDFVVRLGWLTNEELLDAVAVGQFTPGPVFTTATFIGYLVGGLPGALLATLGIFLPAFVFVAATARVIGQLRRSPWLAALLDGVNVAAVGLMAAVTIVLVRDAIVDWFTVALTALALLALLRGRVNSAWLVVGGAAAGVAYQAIIG